MSLSAIFCFAIRSNLWQSYLFARQITGSEISFEVDSFQKHGETRDIMEVLVSCSFLVLAVRQECQQHRTYGVWPASLEVLQVITTTVRGFFCHRKTLQPWCRNSRQRGTVILPRRAWPPWHLLLWCIVFGQTTVAWVESADWQTHIG